MQPFDIRVRAAAIADLEQILAFIHQKAEFDGFPQAVAATAATLQQTLFGYPPAAEVAFAEVAAKPVGFVLFSQTFASFLAQPTIWMDDLFVPAEWRGQGIGTARLNYVARIANNRNCGRIEWTVATANARGIAFYQKQGAAIQQAVRLCRMTVPAIAQLANPSTGDL